MAIVFSCTCGRPLRAKEETAGKKTKCPHCGAVLTIPTSAAKAPAAMVAGSDMAHTDAVPIELAWPAADPPPAAAAVHEAHDEAAGIKVDASATGGPAPGEPPRPSDAPKIDGILQYKVLGQKDHSTSAKFNPLRLEEVLNEHARKGWVVKAAVVVTVQSHAGDHDEMIVILER